MNLYLINPNIELNNATIYYILKVCELKLENTYDAIVEINKVEDIYQITQGYIDMLTYGKLQHNELCKSMDYYISRDYNSVIYYLIITKQISLNKIIYDIAKHGALSCLKICLNYGVNINISNIIGITPLYYACCNNNYECASLLLEYGANINITNIIGNSLLHSVCSMKCRGRILKLLLKYCNNINIQNSRYNTPLHMACIHDKSEYVELLLTNGAKTNILNKYGLTPLQLALEHNNTKCIKLLQDFKNE